MRVHAWSRLISILSGLLILGAFSESTVAQTPPLAIDGQVQDASKSAIAGARITLTPSGAESGQTVTADQSGSFILEAEAGVYEIRISAKGFLDLIQSVEPGINSEPRTFQLQVAPVQATVTIRDSPGYKVAEIRSATKTPTPLRDIPQSITVVTQDQIRDQAMQSIGDVVRYVPGVTAVQGENNRDQLVIRGNSTSADFFVNGVRDDVQYYRDLYNLERMEVLKGSNAMVFGRGGGGGVVNRVTKDAGFMTSREVTVSAGSFGEKRIAGDFNERINDRYAFRLNTVAENSNSFRDYVSLKRFGVNPSLTFVPSGQTTVTFSYEYFRDSRGSDRGIPSYQGLPADVDKATFYGNPAYNDVWAYVNQASVNVEHHEGPVTFHNRTMFGDYDRGYQNFVPGAVNAAKDSVALTGYNNATKRRNLFNQTDVTYATSTGRVRHTLLGGAELGLQFTDNFRNTAFFNNTGTSVSVPYSNPVIDTPVTFRQSATDADNHLNTQVGAVYLQDQIELTRQLQAIAGLRFDSFDLKYHNNRTNESLQRVDNLLSPRAGLVFKPSAPLSIYASYGVSYLPSSGDQFSSLTTITQQVEPEKFNNYEAGMKWDLLQRLSLTTAVFRLDRVNTRSTDPNDPSRIIQTGKTSTRGYELGMSGKIIPSWEIAGGYAYQNAFIASATTSAAQGAKVAQTPHHTFSLWNNFQIGRKVGAGVGVISRSVMYAAVDNTVILPGYVRADAALSCSVFPKLRLQLNVENVLDRSYFVNADGNNNISPGGPRTFRLSLTTRF
jgi:catecholate siderophore receptor